MTVAAISRNDESVSPAAAGSSRILIELLGGLRLHIGNNIITRFRTRSAASLLAYLACHRDQRHTREVLAERFWPEATPTSARTNFNTALCSLRNQLEPPGIPPNSILIADSFTVGLNPARVTTDVSRVEELLLKADRTTKDSRAIELLREALQMAKSEFLPGFYDEWIVTEQDRLRDRAAVAAYRLARLLENEGQHEEAMQWIRETVRTNPTHTEAVRQLFEHLVASGQTTEAVACYNELLDRLQAKWSMEPAQEIQTLMAPVLATYTTAKKRGRPPGKGRSNQTLVLEETTTEIIGVAHEVDSAKHQSQTVAEVTTSVRNDARGHDAWLPLPITRFFGRESEIQRLRWLLENPTNRVITHTGPGGSGKTRLALTLAERMRDPVGELRGEMRVVFVSLTDVRDFTALPEALAHGLSITRPIVPSDPLQVIADFLSTEPTLLILDNFEQLVNTGAEKVVMNLLQRVPSLSCLITSRVRVQIHGEQEFPILPLPVPEESVNDGDVETLLRESPAIALFVDRAQLAVPFFQINRKNATAIVQLVRQLEGIPLAIELAAARSRVITPGQMVQQMKERFDLLISHRSLFEGRHRSLRDTIAWSLELLTESQQKYFLELCVLRGTWTADDAEAITCDPMTPEYLAILADASLLQSDIEEDCIRFRMLETIREFAEERFVERFGEEGIQHLRGRHVARFLEVANGLRGIPGADQVSWITQFQNCHDNCCTALEWCVKTPGRHALEAAIRIGTSLGRFWRLAGWHQRGCAYLQMVKGRSDFGDLPLNFQSAFLITLGILEMGSGHLDVAAQLFEQGRQMRAEIGDMAGAHAALNNLAMLSSKRGDHRTAYQAYKEGLAYWQSNNDRPRVTLTYLNMGCAAASMGEFDLADRHLTESKNIAASIGHTILDANALCSLGFLYLERGEIHQARCALEEALRKFAELQTWPDAATALLGLGRVAEEMNDYQQEREKVEIAFAYFDAKGVMAKDLLPFDNSPYWKEKCRNQGRQWTSVSLARAEQRLRRAISWALDEMPILNYCAPY